MSQLLLLSASVSIGINLYLPLICLLSVEFTDPRNRTLSGERKSLSSQQLCVVMRRVTVAGTPVPVVRCLVFSGRHPTHCLGTPADDFDLEEHIFLLLVISIPRVNIISLNLKRFAEVNLYIVKKNQLCFIIFRATTLAHTHYCSQHP